MKRLICVFMVLVLTCVVVSCKQIGDNDEQQISEEKSSEATTVEAEASESLKFVRLPAPAVYKQVLNSEDIDKIYSFILNYPKEKIDEPNNENGWSIYIISSNGTKISFCGNTLVINNDSYIVDDDFEKGLLDLYNEIESEEKYYLSDE